MARDHAGDDDPSRSGVPGEPTGPSRPPRRRAAAAVAAATILVVVFGVLLPQLADYAEAWAAVRAMPPLAVVALLGTVAAIPVVHTLPYLAALPTLTFRAAFDVRHTAYAFRNAVPAGGALGLGVQYAMLSVHGVRPAAATAAIGVTTLADVVLTLGAPAVGLVLLALTGDRDTGGWLLAVLGLAVVVLLLGVVSAVLRREETARRIGSWADRLVARTVGSRGRRPSTDLATVLVEARGAALGVVAGRWSAVVATNVAVPLSQFAALWVSLVAVDGPAVSTSLVQAFAALAVARVLTLVPVTPGGIGVVDAALAGFLTLFGTDPDAALAAVLVWRAVTYLPQVLLGAVAIVRWRRRRPPPGGDHAAPGRPSSAPWGP